MKLSELLKGVDVLKCTADPEMELHEVCYDSRSVGKGDLFVAVRGFATDGHCYIPKAIEQGAAAIICEEAEEGVPAVVVRDSRRALAQIAANRFGHPADKMIMIGVTGTNGKTTVTTLLKHILEVQGHKVGLIGTNKNMCGSEVLPADRTTPESYEMQALLAHMAEQGCTHVLMEVSSHALVLDRVYGIRYAVGVFTNLTQDHLDFHHTMEEYRKAKAILFKRCDKGVMNADDPVEPLMLADAECPVLTTSSAKDDADLIAKDIEMRADHVAFTAQAAGHTAAARLNIPGQFSVQNALSAIGACLQLGISLEDAVSALRSAHGVKGRAEIVPTPTDYTVLIDYAHSPDGVENILKAVRGFAKGRVIALFGCGGDRDRTKRPKMGAIAARLADFCIVTSDNPRTEKPEAIIREIVAGMQDSKTPREVITNRPEAIHYALDMAQTGDVVVLMGKGHETYQEINHVKHHLDEREIIAEYFAK